MLLNTSIPNFNTHIVSSTFMFAHQKLMFCSLSAPISLGPFFFYRSQTQILELTSVLTNKLDFLEVSRKGVSNLKILLIEMEVNNLSF